MGDSFRLEIAIASPSFASLFYIHLERVDFSFAFLGNIDVQKLVTYCIHSMVVSLPWCGNDQGVRQALERFTPYPS